MPKRVTKRAPRKTATKQDRTHWTEAQRVRWNDAHLAGLEERFETRPQILDAIKRLREHFTKSPDIQLIDDAWVLGRAIGGEAENVWIGQLASEHRTKREQYRKAAAATSAKHDEKRELLARDWRELVSNGWGNLKADQEIANRHKVDTDTVKVATGRRKKRTR